MSDLRPVIDSQFDLQPSKMSGDSFLDKHFRLASRTRLIAYAVAALTVVVVIILWITLSSSDEEPKYRGSDAIRESPLVDGSGGFAWQIHTKFKDKISGLNLEKPVQDSQNVPLQTNLADYSSGFVSAQIWEITDSCDSKALDSLMSGMVQYDLIDRIIKSYPDRLKFGLSSKEISSAFDEKKTAIFSSLNGGHMMADKLAVLRNYYRDGVRIFTLNKNECVEKKLSKFVATEDPNAKNTFVLSKLVQTVIQELNRLGMIIDLSGSDTNTQVEILKIAKAPVIFSHSVTSLSTTSPFAVTDDVLQKLKTNNGLLMLNFGAAQVATTPTVPPDMTTLIAHLNYVRDKIGADYIGIGAGFDSSEQFKPVLKSPAQYPDLFDKLAEGSDKFQPWSEADLKKLAGQNFERIFMDVEKFRDNSAGTPPFEYEEEEKSKKDDTKPNDDKTPKKEDEKPNQGGN